MAVVAFIGSFISLILELIQRYFKKRNITIDRTEMLLGLMAFSVVAAGIKFLAVRFGFWEGLVGIITAAAAFHNLVIRNVDLLTGDKPATMPPASM